MSLTHGDSEANTCHQFSPWPSSGWALGSSPRISGAFHSCFTCSRRADTPDTHTHTHVHNPQSKEGEEKRKKRGHKRKIMPIQRLKNGHGIIQVWVQNLVTGTVDGLCSQRLEGVSGHRCRAERTAQTYAQTGPSLASPPSPTHPRLCLGFPNSLLS